MELLFEKEFAKLFYEEADRLMYLELIGVIGSQEYRETFTTLLQKAIEKNINKLLVNQATMEKSSMESKAWLIASWMPKVKKQFGDDIRVALLLSKNLFTKIGGEYIVGVVRTLGRFDIKAFGNMEEARNWVMEKK